MRGELSCGTTAVLHLILIWLEESDQNGDKEFR